VALSADRIEHLTGEFEEITYLADPRSGLRAILAVHDTSLGPALGGIRCCAYEDEAAALADALDLARDMTAKVMLAELPAGGGKCVVLDHPGLDRKEAYSRLGDHIDAMRGRSSTWTRIRVNLEHVPEDLRPPQEPLDPDFDPWAGVSWPEGAKKPPRRRKAE
jgi:leucine dehydrogenase